MDKNKNRTDMLAAGRKKLQQFRQKKDNKGNTSKSSGKAFNSGCDASANAANKAVVKLKEVAGGERSGHDAEDHIPMSELHSRVNSKEIDSVSATDDLSTKAVIVGITELAAGNVKFTLEDSGLTETRLDQSDGHDDVDLSISDEGRYTSIFPVDVEHIMSGTLDLVVPKEESTESRISLPIGFSSQQEKKHGEEQVTDVGAVQEVGTSGGIQTDAGRLMQLEGESRLSSNEFDECAGVPMMSDSGIAKVAEATIQVDTQREPDDASSSVVPFNDTDDAQGRDGTKPLPDSEGLSDVNSEVTGLQRQDLLSDLSYREKTDMVSVSGDYAEGTDVNFGYINAERSSEFNTKRARKSFGQKVDLSSGLDGSLISLSRLAKILQSLDEDEFRFLFMSRELSAETLRNTDNLKTEALMQALDEEEAQMENLTNRIGNLERELQQNNEHLENLEVSRRKALKKLLVTVSKFDELHYLSENLLSEVEKLQLQLQERDGEISFLRQEVTRCTNDALAATQMSKKRSSDNINDFLTWLDALISRVQVNDLASDSMKVDQANEYQEKLQKQIVAFVSKLENLRVVAQNSDMLLQEARGKVEELTRKEQYLKDSLHEKDSQLTMLQGAGDSGQAPSATSDIMKVEQVTNKWTTPTIASQVHNLRKTNSDQVAIAIDIDPSNERLEDDDDDKAHGFKSLTTSRLVPQFTRPLTNMIDGLWMSCDRALMRQPALRLGVIIYWAVLHALPATFVV